MDYLIIINDGPYGTERAYNGLRFGRSLQREHTDVGVRAFLMADSVHCALPGQLTQDGLFNIGRQLLAVMAKGGEVRACGTWVKARGVAELELPDGVGAGTMADLSAWVVGADKAVSI